MLLEKQLEVVIFRSFLKKKKDRGFTLQACIILFPVSLPPIFLPIDLIPQCKPPNRNSLIPTFVFTDFALFFHFTEVGRN